MPLSSLFSRKPNKKSNPPKDKSDEATKGKTPAKGVNSTDETKILHASPHISDTEGKVCEESKCVGERVETSSLQEDIETSSNPDKTADCGSDVPQKHETETRVSGSRTEEKISGNVDVQSANFSTHTEMILQPDHACVSAEESYLRDVNGTEHHENTSADDSRNYKLKNGNTREGGSCLLDANVAEHHESPSADDVRNYKLPNGSTNEECQINDRDILLDQHDLVVERNRKDDETGGQSDPSVTSQENAVPKSIKDLAPQKILSESRNNEFTQQKEDSEIEKEEEAEMAMETNGDKSNDKILENFQSVTATQAMLLTKERSTADDKASESVEYVSEPSETEESATKGAEVVLSDESVSDPCITAMVTRVREVDGDLVKQINHSDYTSSVSSKESMIKDEQTETKLGGNSENEMGEINNSAHVVSQNELFESEDITDPLANGDREKARDNCERITDETEGGIAERGKGGDQKDLRSAEEQNSSPDGTIKELHDGDDREEMIGTESETEIRTDSYETNEILVGGCSTKVLLNNPEKCTFVILTSGADSTGDEMGAQTNTVGRHRVQQILDGGEQPDAKEEVLQDVDRSNEVPEDSTSLTDVSKDNFGEPLDSFPDVEAAESTTSLDDCLESFPSECDDFLGGQRKLMAQEQTPSWKVGYLQVKLPVKSRGRGKLKVWRQRWVVIQMDEFVKDVKDPSLMINIYASECSNARSHSALFWSTVTASSTLIYRSQSRTHKYAFSVSVDNDVILHLAADSETASQEWIAAIRNLLWPPSPVVQLEKVLHGSEFEVSVIDNEFSFHAGLLGAYGNMKVTSNKLILSHPQSDHVIQEWYLNTLDKFHLLKQNKEEDAFKVVIMHTGQDSSTGSGQIILFCADAVAMLQSIASTIHKLLQYRTSVGKDHNQKEMDDLADWLSPILSKASAGELSEDYYQVPRRQIKSLLDIPNFCFEKPIEGGLQGQEVVSTRPSMLTSATSASTFSQDSGISLAIQPDDFLNCSVTSFTIGGRPVRDHTSSESSDAYSPPCTPEVHRKEKEAEAT